MRRVGIEAAFESLCKGAKEPKAIWVSLYCHERFYGGPEEGGWWGHDTKLVASHMFKTDEAAQDAVTQIRTLAESHTNEAAKAFHQQCREECDWLEARGLDDDFLPEVRGHDDYFVLIEKRRGSHESQGCRHYE